MQPKFHVKDAAGKLDEAASLRKQAEAYAPLVARLGTDELPPKAASDYKITAPADLKPEGFAEFMKDPATVGALDNMHKLGLTNTQANAVMGMYLEAAQRIAAGGPVLDAQGTIADLKQGIAGNPKAAGWASDADLRANIGNARHVATVLGERIGIDFAAIEKAGLGNNPTFIRLMASLAPELGEDKAPGGAALPLEDLDALTKSPAYMDPKHADHARVKAKVAAHFASIPGAQGKASGPVVFSTGAK